VGDVTRGLYNKFYVRRTDGRSRKGQRHYHCQYFVLDLDHDEFALIALRAYARACREKYALLAVDLLSEIGRRESEKLPDQKGR